MIFPSVRRNNIVKFEFTREAQETTDISVVRKKLQKASEAVLWISGKKMPSTRSKSKTTQNRSVSGLFKLKCGAIIHDAEQPNSGRLFSLQSKGGKKAKIKQKERETLLKKGIISNRTKHICSACLHSCKASQEEEEDIELSVWKEDGEESLGNNTDDQGSSSDTECSCQLPVEEFIKSLLPLIAKDIALLYSDKELCSIDRLLDYNSSEWLQKRPKCLVKILSLLCRIPDGELKEEGKSTWVLSKIIELMYSISNSRLQLPISFPENLLVYSLTHSKQLVRYNSSIGPAGSYSFLHDWIKGQAAEPVPYPSGLAKSVFDNEQVIGNTRSVKAENKVPGSVITSHAYLNIDENNNIQNNDIRLCPRVWFFRAPSDDQKNNFVNIPQEEIDLFRMTRNAFIEERIQAVLEEQFSSEEDHEYHDFVDAVVAQRQEANNEKICLECGAANDIKYNSCRYEPCKGKLVKRKINDSNLTDEKPKVNTYTHFTNLVTVKENNISVKCGEPDFLNPNSFENICQVLRNLAVRAGIRRYNGEQHHWIILEVDSTIYCVVERLIFNVLSCPNCKDSYYGEEAFKDHVCWEEMGIQPEHEFDWIVLVPGQLHIEMNSCKAFFGLNWNIFVCDIAKVLGFKSEKALAYAQRCSDHHKTWQIIELMYTGIADELLVPFIRSCKKDGIQSTVQSYWTWNQDVCNPNYAYTQQMVFTSLHAMMLFRIGIRNGNAHVANAGKRRHCSMQETTQITKG